MTEQVKTEVERLLREGKRDAAISYLQQRFDIAPADALLLVETLEREKGIAKDPDKIQAEASTSDTSDEAFRSEIIELVRRRRQTDAFRRVREVKNMGFREALETIGKISGEEGSDKAAPAFSGCLRTVAKGLGVFLMIVSLMFLVGAALVYYVQWRTTSLGHRVDGNVVRLKTIDSGGSAPVVEYVWQGEKRAYESTFYTSPPDYYEGQTVTLFIDPSDPGEGVIDTFEDRWALIVGLSVPAAFFLAISIVILHFAKRKF